MDSQRRLFPSALFFIAAILLGLFIQFKLISEKILFEYDDAITILVSTGHEGEYAEVSSSGSYPIGEWVPAKVWQRFIEWEPGRGLRQVALDLSHYDIHPPLYFWTLYLWISAFGAGLLSVQLFNVFLELVILMILLWIGLLVFHSPSKAMMLSAAWLLSPITGKTAFWIRQYTFFGLILLVFFYLFYRFGYLPGKIKLFSSFSLWLGLTILAGLFTHFYFLIFLLMGLVVVEYRALFYKKQRIIPMFATAILGITCLLFFIYPGFFQSLDNYLVKMLHFNTSPVELAVRVRNAVKTLVLLFSPVLLGLALGVVGVWAEKGKDRGVVAKLTTAGKELLSRLKEQPFFCWSLVFVSLPLFVILVLYLLGLSPLHTFSSRYLGFISPSVAFIPIFLVTRSKNHFNLQPFFYMGMFLLGLSSLFPGLAQSQEGWIDRSSLNQAEFIVIDSIQWGTWPGIVPYLRDSQEVFINGQEQLLANSEAWLSRTGKEGFIYISIIRGVENTPAGQKKILGLLDERYQVTELSEAYRPDDWSLRLYSVQPVR